MNSACEGTDVTREQLAYICEKFRIPGVLVDYHLIESGHINTTYHAAYLHKGEIKEYLVQQVNWYVFRQPVEMMHNIELITEHIRKKQGEQTERRRRLHFYHTEEGNNYLMLGEGEAMQFWRVANYIENSVSFESAAGDKTVLRMSGIAFGQFLAALSDFDASQLTESIPHFHDTRFRLETLREEYSDDSMGRAEMVRSEVEEILSHARFAETFCRLIDAGKLPIRVTHNDTKTNNVLFDKYTLEPLVVIDLDTVMPGLAAYDFGDTIRFAAATAVESEPEQSSMRLNLELFQAYAEGFIHETAEYLTQEEIDTMAFAAPVITLELASRFLVDYLVGDKYFRISYPEHNLVRARAQLALFKDMMLHVDEMAEIIHKIAGR